MALGFRVSIPQGRALDPGFTLDPTSHHRVIGWTVLHACEVWVQGTPCQGLALDSQFSIVFYFS